MAKKKPEIQLPSRRRRTQPDEERVRELEERAEATQTAPATGSPLASELPPASPVASELAESSLEPKAHGAGTQAKPYIRASDGRPTRGTTIVFPVDLHERLRLFAFQSRRTQSDVVCQALAEFLDGTD